MSALAKLSLLYEEATSAKQEVEYRLNGLNIAQAAYDQAIANYEAKRAAYYAAATTNFPPITEGRMEASSSPNSDPSIKDFGGGGNSWLSMARQATSGKEQVGKLKAIFYSQILKAIPKKGTRAAVVEWATNQGYVLPDLRAEEYIYGNRKEAESLNPKLFESLGGYRK